MLATETRADLPSTNFTGKKSQDFGYSPFFDIRKSRDWYYRSLKNNHGNIEITDRESLPVLQKDLLSQAWEAIDSKKPYEYRYQIVNGQKLVHESDQSTQKDIAEGLDPTIRRGSERLGILNFRQALLNAKVGETVVQASPMKHKYKETQADCYYPDTFISIGQRVLVRGEDGTDREEVQMRQFKSRFISPEQARDVVNQAVGYQAIEDPNDLDSTIQTAAAFNGTITNQRIIDIMEQVSGVKIEDGPDFNLIKQRADFAASQLLLAFKRSYSAEQLAQIHAQLLIKILGNTTSSKIHRDPYGRIQIQTNCGSYSLGSSQRLSYGGTSSFMSRGETESSGEEICPDCSKTKKIGSCGLCINCFPE